jgi:hypothetical protein
VFDYGDEDGLATVLNEGESVSAVRYDRGDLFGKTGYVNNRQLKPVKDPAHAKRKPKPQHEAPEAPEGGDPV